MTEAHQLFPNFTSAFKPDEGSAGPCPGWSASDTRSLVGAEPRLFTEFINTAARSSFNNGLMRFLLPATEPSLRSWNAPTGWMGDWPNVPKFFVVFAFDWQGNQYGFDKRRMNEGEPLVGLLEPGQGKLLKIPATFADFLEREIVENRDALLALSFYADWLRHAKAPSFDQSVGYRVPPFLNGKDELANLELGDTAMYLTMTGQMFSARR